MAFPVKEQLLLVLACAASDGRATNAEEAEFIAYIDALERDAQRFRAAVSCMSEPDDAKREAMMAAMDSYDPQLQQDAIPTPERVCQVLDEMLLAAAKARDAANSQT
jgi:hypothetical protein